MCVPGCHEVLHERLSRRGFFKGSAALAMTATAATIASREAVARTPNTFKRVVDLSHTLSPDFPTYLPDWALQVEQLTNFAEHGFNARRYSMVEHCGTHIDAPLHFSADGASADEIPLDDLVLPLAVIDVRAMAAEDADYQLTPDAGKRLCEPRRQGCLALSRISCRSHEDVN